MIEIKHLLRKKIEKWSNCANVSDRDYPLLENMKWFEKVRIFFFDHPPNIAHLEKWRELKSTILKKQAEQNTICLLNTCYCCFYFKDYNLNIFHRY